MDFPSLSLASHSPSSSPESEAGRSSENFGAALRTQDPDHAPSAGQEASFPFDRLPPELQTNVLHEAASFEDRGEANSAIQGLRQANSFTKALIDHGPRSLQEKVAALQRNPGEPSRTEAAYADYVRGRLPREASRVNGVTDENEINGLVSWGAKLAFASDPNATARGIIDRFEVTSPKDVNSLKMTGAERDFSNGKRALDAVKDNDVDEPFDKNLMLLRGARNDFAAGASAPEAIRRNQEPGIHELSDFSRDQLLYQGAERDIASGVMTRQEAIDLNGVTNPSHRDELLGSEQQR